MTLKAAFATALAGALAIGFWLPARHPQAAEPRSQIVQIEVGRR